MVGALKEQEGRGEKRNDAGGVGSGNGGVCGVGPTLLVVQERYSYFFVADDFRCEKQELVQKCGFQRLLKGIKVRYEKDAGGGRRILMIVLVTAYWPGW